MLAYNINDRMITVITPDGPIHLARKGKRAKDVIEALNNGETDVEVLKELADPTTYIATSSGGRIAIKDGVASIDGEELPELLGKRLVQLVNDGIPTDYLVKFYERLQKNPSRRSVQELFTFLEHGGFPITPDGMFLGYKGINDNWTDCHTGRISNKIGNRIRMPRNKVDDNCDHGCSVGFHVGSEDYATGFGSITVIVEVDPAHVVSVPKDCNFQKLRVCEYKVVAKYQKRMVDSGVEDSSLPYNAQVIPEGEDEEGFDPNDVEVVTD